MWQSVVVTSNFDAVLDAVGPRLRALRGRRNMTLNEVSASTGVSASTLSRLEAGQRRPNLELLLPIAELYDLPLDDLVGAPRTGDPRIHLRPIQHSGMTAVPLTRRPGGVQAFKMVLAGNTRDSELNLQVHEGYEWLYILNGALRLVLGDNDFVVGPGRRSSSTPTHLTGSPVPTASPWNSSVCSGGRGERMHVRARPKSS